MDFGPVVKFTALCGTAAFGALVARPDVPWCGLHEPAALRSTACHIVHAINPKP